MEDCVAVIAIAVRDLSAAQAVNALLHEYAACILGRMGLPCHDRAVSLITVVLDAPADQINALAGKLGRIADISVKSVQIKL